MNVIDWLLAGDPAIRWQVLRDLTNAPVGEDQQHPSFLVDNQDRHGRQQQQLVPDNGPQPGYMRGDTHLGKPTAWGSVSYYET